MRFELKSNPPIKHRFKSGTVDKFHVFEGTPAEFFRWAESLPRFSRYTEKRADSWAGFFKESPAAAIPNRTSIDALDSVEQNRAELHAPLKAPAKPVLSPVGASFSIGRVLQGHPVCAFRRPRIALPPKNLNFALSVSAFVDQAKIARSIARIASAAWNYHLNGGSVNIKLHYILHYSEKAADGSSGLLISLNIPIADLSSLATGASIQFFRGFAIPAAQAISPVERDPLYRGDSTIPGVFTLCGDERKDAAALEHLKVE